MTRFDLSAWLRARLLPLVVSTAAVVAISAPCAFYLRERYDAVTALRADATRAAEVLRAEIESRPRLWRYGAGKLAEHLAEEGLGRTPLRVQDAQGSDVHLDGAPLPPSEWALWGRAELRVEGQRAATVWAAADQRPLLASALELGVAFALLAVALATVLYLVPLRAIATAERRLAFSLQEEDRRRIARELHDGVGQAITAARLQLLAAAARARLPAADVAAVAGRLDEALDEVRRSSNLLAPPALAELGLPRALERHCATFGGASGFDVQCVVDAALPKLDADVEAACYRIVQEALTNAARHGGATRASVSLRMAARGSLALEIGDDGAGFAERVEGGHGLEGIRERARLLGGEVRIESPPGSGVRLEVRLPVEVRS